MPRTHVTDGNYRVAMPVGMPIISFPFTERRDNRTFEYEIKYRILASFYRGMQPMTRQKFPQGYAYLTFEGNQQDVGGGIMEFTRIFSALPLPGFELTTIIHSRQEIIDNRLIETQDTVPGFVKWEYSLRPIPQIDAPRAVEIAEGVFQTKGGFGTFTPGKQYLAEDTEIGIWKGSIFYRKSVSIVWRAFRLRSNT